MFEPTFIYYYNVYLRLKKKKLFKKKNVLLTIIFIVEKQDLLSFMAINFIISTIYVIKQFEKIS